MFRVCQLCLLTRSTTRPFSVGKVKWSKGAIPTAKVIHDDSPPSPTERLVDVDLKLKQVPILKLEHQKPTTKPAPSLKSSSALSAAVKSILQQDTRPKEFGSNVEVSASEAVVDDEPAPEPPLKLLNAADPKILVLAAAEAHKLDLSKLPIYYLGLSKSRLTGLVVVTAMAGYALGPAAFALGPFASLTIGTALTSASANTINQIMEVPFDSQMDRTKNRVLVRNLLSVQHATAFAAVTGIGGLAILAFGANGLTAALGGLNLVLYTCLYTPMKRKSIANTWVGSIVGGIPPVMGWAACTGELSHGALLLGCILYAWQFPHFNALSWNLRKDYDKAGYKMMAISHPDLCKKVSLRYSFGIIAMCTLAPVCNVTSWTFVLDSLPVNGYLAFLAYKFYQDGDSASSRKLFRYSLIHLPLLIMLMIISKQNYPEKKCLAAEISSQISTVQLPPTPTVLTSITEHSFKG